MTSGEDEHVQNLPHVPPKPRESDTANQGADSDWAAKTIAKIRKPGAIRDLNEIEVLNQLRSTYLVTISYHTVTRLNHIKTNSLC
jgi:hypothetical protein